MPIFINLAEHKEMSVQLKLFSNIESLFIKVHLEVNHKK